MSETRSKSPYLLAIGIILPTAGILVFDFFLPSGVAAGVLYTIPVLMTLWLPERRTTFLTALIGSVLTVLGFSLSPSGGVLWMILLNRSISLFMIWSTAILVLRHKRISRQIETLHGLLPICSACKKIRDDQEKWTHLEVFIEQRSKAQFTHSMCPECVTKYYGDLSEP